jgi:tetratricopeptide (TPR) repeat protein
MKRRDFNRGLLGLGVTALLGPLDQGVGPAASWTGGVEKGFSPAEHFLRIRRTLADNDNLLGPRLVIPTAIDQVRAIQRARQRVDGTDLRAILHVQAQFADLLGWLHQDSGDFPASQYWMDRALDWAHQTGDRDSVVFVLARKSQLAGDMQNAAEAVDVAEAAMRLAGPQNRLAAVAATYAAHGYALRGDRVGCERSYEAARSLLDQAERDDSPWARFFDAAYIGVQRAHSLAALGDDREAVRGFRAAIEHLQPGYHRDLGVYLSREAMAHAGLGEIDHAAELGLRALVIRAETGSERILTELFALNAALTKWTITPTVARFNEALAAVGPRR